MRGDGHLGDGLSALLDGELGEHEADLAAAHLDACEACRDELAAVQAGRALVRGLPFVEPPVGFVDQVIGSRRRRRRRAAAAAGLASVATFATLVLGGAYDEMPEVGADLAMLQEAHLGSPMGEPMEPDEMPGTVVPPRIDRFERTQVHADRQLVQVTYADEAGHQLTIFEGRGSVPGAWLLDAEPMELEVDGDARQGFVAAFDQVRVLVLEVGDSVYALLADTSDDLGDEVLVDAADDLPGPGGGAGVLDRARTVVVRVGEVLRP